MVHRATAILCLFSAACASGQTRTDAEAVVLEAGPLTCEIRISRTAHLFHVVDQLAEWSPFCHRQYGRHLAPGLTPEDRADLQRHAAIRTAKGWGGGLEQTFYTPLDLDAALRAGVEARHLSSAEAEIERRVLSRFAPRVEALMAAEAPVLRGFIARLERERGALEAFSRTVSRFFGGVRVTVPVYLMANPADRDCGGGFNGGRLTLEVPRAYDVYPIFLHEVFHAFIETRRPALERVVRGVEGLDTEALNEGLAYALSPGLIHPDGGSDPLRQRVVADLGKPLSDPYVRFNRYGLALRPLLAAALEDPAQTLDAFLPRAIDAWRVMTVLTGSAAPDYRTDPTPSVFVFGEHAALGDRLRARGGTHLFGRNHKAAYYEEILARHAKPGDTVVLAVSLDSPERVPDAWQDLLPRPWAEIEAALQEGRTVDVEGRARGFRVVLLAAPTARTLQDLQRETPRF